MKNLDFIISQMKELRNNIISEKNHLKMLLADLSKKSDEAIANGDIKRAQELSSEKQEVLDDLMFLKSIDENNNFTYNTLGYIITGYQMRKERINKSIKTTV